jgi:hypothetical protein
MCRDSGFCYLFIFPTEYFLCFVLSDNFPENGALSELQIGPIVTILLDRVVGEL